MEKMKLRAQEQSQG
uniref:Uncharacterized protein n=1 Tax=Anguilla anguilla TaxID=7936 RepID=A0A0E9S1Y6_ANGAN